MAIGFRAAVGDIASDAGQVFEFLDQLFFLGGAASQQDNAQGQEERKFAQIHGFEKAEIHHADWGMARKVGAGRLPIIGDYR